MLMHTPTHTLAHTHVLSGTICWQLWQLFNGMLESMLQKFAHTRTHAH